MEHDIATARHGGIHSCAVLTGYNTLEQLRAAKPDLIVEHLGELRKKLEQTDLEIAQRDDAKAGANHSREQGTGSTKSRPAGEEMPIATVGALIFDEADRVLMIRTHKWSDLWGIPGGKIKWGESSEDALRRELKEE